jgi:transposase
MGEVARLGAPGRARRTRRRWTIAEKLAIVAAAKTSGDPIAVVARRHGMNTNHLFNWLQRDRDGTLDRRALGESPGGAMDFLDLGVIGRGPPMVEIDLPCGAKVRVGADVEAAALGAILLAVKAAS